jgi:hypothetical protein
MGPTQLIRSFIVVVGVASLLAALFFERPLAIAPAAWPAIVFTGVLAAALAL